MFKKRLFSDTHQFMPVLAEIEERPVNPLGRVMFWTIISFVVCVVAWLSFAKSDMFITSRGAVVGGGGERVMVSPFVCVTGDIHCRKGDFVTMGQPLLTLVSPSSEKAKEFIEGQLKRVGKDGDKGAKQHRQTWENALNDIRSLSLKKIISSPYTGIVKDIFCNASSGVIMPGQKIISITSTEHPVAFESFIEARDAGLIHLGMKVKINPDSFASEKDGTLDGEVVHIALSDQKYKIVTVPSISKTDVNRAARLSPGMEGTVVIKTGEQALIKFMIYPLTKYMGEKG